MHLRRLLAVVALALLLLSPASTDQTVIFNLHSHKYHCATCRAARSCTRNCVKMSLGEAIKRGGAACKICGGVCQK